MCEPATLISTGVGLASTLAGTLMQNSAAQSTYDQQAKFQRENQAAQAAEMERARRAREESSRHWDAELERQEQFRQQRNDAFQSSLDAATPEAREEQRATAEASRAAMIDTAPQPDVAAPVSGDAPAVVNRTVGRSIAGGIREGRDEAKRAARLGSWTDASRHIGQTLNMGDDLIRMYGDFARGSNAVSGIEQNAALEPVASANQSIGILGGAQAPYPKTSPIGDMLVGAGQGIAGYGGQLYNDWFGSSGTTKSPVRK